LLSRHIQGQQVIAALVIVQPISSSHRLSPPPHAPSSAITWNQRSRVPGAAAAAAGWPAPPSAFSSPKNIKRGLARNIKRSPCSGVPTNSPQRAASSLQDGSALMIIEHDILSAGMALTGVAPHLRLPRVVCDADGMFGDADAELASLMLPDQDDVWEVEEGMCAGRQNPNAQQLRDNDLARFYAQKPQDAIYVQAKRL
jgi:hypothetical protein